MDLIIYQMMQFQHIYTAYGYRIGKRFAGTPVIKDGFAHRIDAGQLFAATLFDGFRIPKSSLVSFLASEYAFRLRQKSEVHSVIVENWLGGDKASDFT